MGEIKIGIEGIILTPLKIIEREVGNIMHAMKEADYGYAGFGEAYFTFVTYKAIKGWKKHTQMTLNLVVPAGTVKFVMFDGRQNSNTKNSFFEVSLSRKNYQRLTVPPGVWIAFQGVNENENMVLNIGNIKHDPTETEDLSIDNPHLKYAGWI
jgi:dTDP-4-dehydrorhamnose 3,5-epimerase